MFFKHSKKKSYVFFICLIAFALDSNGQEEEKSPIVNFLKQRGYSFARREARLAIPDSLKKWPDTLYYNTVYRATLLGSPTIPISFSKIEHVNGKYQVSPSISLGYGYTWFKGDFIFNENDKITIDPTFFFGVIGDIGLQNDFALDKLASVFTGGFIGFGAFSLFGGYDFITNSASVGLGGRIDLFTISQNFMKPIGNVRELRKHKSVAIPISNE